MLSKQGKSLPVEQFQLVGVSVIWNLSKTSFQLIFLGHPDFTISSVDSKLNVLLTETTVGKPSLEGFVFYINGFYADNQLLINADEESIEEAIMYLYSPKCPEEIGAAIGRSQVY